MHDWELTPEVMVAVKVDIINLGRVIYVHDAHNPVGIEQHSPRQHSSESSVLCSFCFHPLQGHAGPAAPNTWLG